MIFENNNVVSSSNNSNTDLSSQTSPMSLNKNLSGLNLNSHAIYLVIKYFFVFYLLAIAILAYNSLKRLHFYCCTLVNI